MTESKQPIKDQLDKSLEAMPAELSSKLAQVRQEALQQTPTRSLTTKLKNWMTGGLISGAAIAGLMVALIGPNQSTFQKDPFMFEVLAHDQADFEVAENMEFVLWLNAAEASGLNADSIEGIE